MLFSRPVRAVALAAATTAAVGTILMHPAAAGAPATTADPARAAAGWLARQLVGGTHLVSSYDGSFDGGATADAIFALAASKTGRTTVTRATAYLAKHVEKYVDIRNRDGYGPNDGAIGKTALAAMVAGADPTSFGGYNLLQHLKADECTAHSATCPAAGSAANSYSSISQSLVVTAEARGAAVDAKYAPSPAALDYLLSLQCPNGGFTAGTKPGKKCAADIDATGYAVMALQAAGGQDRPITKAVDWLSSVRGTDGAWTSQGTENTDSTGLATAALTAAGRDTSASRAWLARQQVTTGPILGRHARRGALKYKGSFDAALSVKATCDGMLGLVPDASLATLTAKGSSAGTSVLAAPGALADTGRDGTRTRTELVVGLACLALGGLALLLGRRRMSRR